jgi:hypothetical protein
VKNLCTSLKEDHRELCNENIQPLEEGKKKGTKNFWNRLTSILINNVKQSLIYRSMIRFGTMWEHLSFPFRSSMKDASKVVRLLSK